MARPPRLDLPGVAQHVIQRGNNRAACFFCDADRRFYLKCIRDAAERRACEVHAYALMTNHVHLLVTPLEAGCVGAMLQDVGRRYVRVINTLHGRTGTLWEARYRSSLIDSENYLLACQRYIELNPVRAGLASDPATFFWSSHAHYLGSRPNALITEHPVYRQLGATPAERQQAYRALFGSALDERVMASIRDAINANSALGSEAFMTAAEITLGRSVRIPTRGRPAKSVTEKLL